MKTTNQANPPQANPDNKLPPFDPQEHKAIINALQQSVVSYVMSSLRASHAMHTDYKIELHALLIKQVEQVLFSSLFAYFRGNRTQIALALGINRKTVAEKLKSFGIKEEDLAPNHSAKLDQSSSTTKSKS